MVIAVKALACELPAATGVPLARWHCPDLARQAAAQGIVASVSGTAIWRWLSADAIKPWRVRSWIFPRDPAFAVKAGRVLDLYARTWQGELPGEDDHVISADEKTSIQARIRRHPSPPAARRAELATEKPRSFRIAAGAATTGNQPSTASARDEADAGGTSDKAMAGAA